MRRAGGTSVNRSQQKTSTERNDPRPSRLSSRRGFLTGIAGGSLCALNARVTSASAPAGSALSSALLRPAAEEEVTLVIGMPEAISNPDPPILGSVGYGDTKVITDNINEGLVRFKPGTVEV